MAKGIHQGRLIVRQYTAAYTRLFARDLKDLLTLPLGNYSLTDESSPPITVFKFVCLKTLKNRNLSNQVAVFLWLKFHISYKKWGAAFKFIHSC